MHLKRFFNSALICLGCILLGIFVGCIAMTCAYVMPTHRMLPNVANCRDSFDVEGDGFYWAPDYPISRLDGYTDSTMIQTAVFQTTDNPLKAAMRNQRMEFPKANLNPSVAVLNYVNGARDGEVVSYGRYWHGYLVLLKPLLTVFTLSDIRVCNMVVQYVLLLALLLLAYRKGGIRLVFPLAVAVLALNPLSTALSLQFSSIYLLTLIFCILQLYFELYRRKYGWLLYLWLGIATAFFDFLTYPPAGWAICTAVAVLMMDGSAKEKLLHTLGSGIAWCVGYGGMWSGKWIVGSLISGENILLDAAQSVQYRTGFQVESIADSQRTFQYADVLERNLGAYLNIPMLILFAALLLLLGYLILFRGYRLHPGTALIPSLLLIALVPFVWYLVLKNHSGIHYWMTHRNLSAVFIALSGFFSFSLRKPEYTKKSQEEL